MLLCSVLWDALGEYVQVRTAQKKFEISVALWIEKGEKEKCHGGEIGKRAGL